MTTEAGAPVATRSLLALLDRIDHSDVDVLPMPGGSGIAIFAPTGTPAAFIAEIQYFSDEVAAELRRRLPSEAELDLLRNQRADLRKRLSGD